MARSRDNMDPVRLCDAAQAALEASLTIAQLPPGSSRYPADLMGTPNQPACLCDFNRWEIEQACLFLVRLGLLEPHRRNRAA